MINRIKKTQVMICLLIPCMTACISQQTKPVIDNLRILRQQADQAYADKKYTQAVNKYTEVQKHVENDPVIWFRLGNAYSHLEQPDNSIAAYRKAVALDARFSKAWHNMGVMQMRQSANTWTQMIAHIPESDPLYGKAVQYAQGLLEVLDGETSADSQRDVEY